MVRPTHLSLFSGVGGIDIAAHWAGFETVGFCEWKDHPHAIMQKRFPGIPGWRDIHDLTGVDFYAKTGLHTVDLISGGFPCQPFSVAGQRRDTEDNRHLWPEMLRIIAEIKPACILGENVAGLLSMGESVGNPHLESRSLNRLPGADYYHGVHTQQERMLLHGVVQDLCNLGYTVQPFVVPACAAYAPHRRDRIFIVAYNSQRQREQRRQE